MSKFVNNTGMLGPYPGITWEEHAKNNDWDENCPFSYMVTQQYEVGVCDHWNCNNKIEPEYQFCSLECYEEWEKEHLEEADSEVRSS